MEFSDCEAIDSMPKEYAPDNEQRSQHEGDGKLKNMAQKRWHADLLLVGDGFDHEIRAIAGRLGFAPKRVKQKPAPQKREAPHRICILGLDEGKAPEVSAQAELIRR
jgi:hypothetical protein